MGKDTEFWKNYFEAFSFISKKKMFSISKKNQVLNLIKIKVSE